MLLSERRAIGSFTEAISAADWQPKGVEVGLCSFTEGWLDGAALVQRGRKVVTGKYRMTFSRFVDFEPISFKDIEERIGPEFRKHFIRSTRGVGKRVPPGTWEELIAVIKHLRPSMAGALDELETQRQNFGHAYGPHEGYQVMAQEKDAVGLALDIFGESRSKILTRWKSPTSGRAAPFLQGINKANLREDPMIINDARIFGDWSKVEEYQVGNAAVFEKGDGRLTIINANRTPIERTLGVDLVYYHYLYDSFVMVQYKRMKKEGNDKWVYRPHLDRNYHHEIERMKTFENTYPDLPKDWTLDEYRLHWRAFYWKLCEAVTFTPTASELIQGMYLPLDYWEVLTRADRARGDGGAVAIERSNIGRYINNTLFIQLVQGGWIGSRARNSTVLSDIIEQCLENGKSVVFAATQNMDPQKSPAPSRHS